MIIILLCLYNLYKITNHIHTHLLPRLRLREREREYLRPRERERERDLPDPCKRAQRWRHGWKDAEKENTLSTDSTEKQWVRYTDIISVSETGPAPLPTSAYSILHLCHWPYLAWTEKGTVIHFSTTLLTTYSSQLFTGSLHKVGLSEA